MHPKPAVKQGHLVLFCPLASTQKAFSAFSFIFFSPHLHWITGFSLPFLSTFPQERHLHRSRLQGWPFLTQGQRAVPPFLVHANLSRDFILLPHLHPTFPLVVWLLGSCLSSDSPLSCTPRRRKKVNDFNQQLTCKSLSYFAFCWYPKKLHICSEDHTVLQLPGSPRQS